MRKLILSIILIASICFAYSQDIAFVNPYSSPIYLNPAFAEEEVTALTWVVNFRRVRSVRRYKFLRKSDNTLLAKGETEWVFVDGESGRPRAIPEELSRLFPLVPEGDEP